MVDYNAFAKTFSQSRKNMKWEEITYFLEYLNIHKPIELSSDHILDIGCGSGRLFGELQHSFLKSYLHNYTGIDLSSELLIEAQKQYPDYSHNFRELNMTDIDMLPEQYGTIFFIASFHHLQTLDERISVLQKASKLLKKGGKICMTNWALNSELNNEKYKKSIIINSENVFHSLDYNIKIGNSNRYYHCFHTKELEYLATISHLTIIENRIFENQKNFITILEK